MDENQTIETRIKNVSSRDVNKKDGSGTLRLYDVETDAGTFTTSIRPVANEAFDLRDKLAKITVKVVQNGNFTNRYLQGVVGEVFEKTGTLDRLSQDDFDKIEKIGEQVFDPAKAVTSTTTDATEEKIHRQVAAKVAAVLYKDGDSSADFWRNCDELVEYFASGKQPSYADFG